MSRFTTIWGDKWRSLVSLAFLLVSGFLATSLVSYFAAHKVLSEQVADSTLPLTSDTIYSEIQKDLLRPVFISSLMAKDTFVRDWTLKGEKNSQRIIHYLTEIMRHYGAVTSFYVSNQTKNYYHPSGILKKVSPHDTQDKWYFDLLKKNEDYDVNIDTDTSNLSKITVFVNYKVYDYHNNVIGAIGVGLDIEQVKILIEHYQNVYKRRVYFVDQKGNIRLHGTNDAETLPIGEQPGLAAIAKRVLSQKTGSFHYYRHGHATYLNSRYVPEFKWYLLVEDDVQHQEMMLKKTLIGNVLFCILITGLVMWLALFVLSGYQRRLEHIATTDKLTGLPNRNLFELHAKKLFGMAHRNNSAISLLVIDVDNFKFINDNYGHVAGDEALKQVGKAAEAVIRESDTICRWGGDEFVVLLPGCSIEQSTDIAEKIRAAVEKNSTQLGVDGLQMSVSLGVAQFHSADTLSTLLVRADHALYKAKQQGRNCVCQEV